ncbi:GNAT family N-acetyltransferase [Candidatus Gottesmanbacteria bacterium]|nr:GNAT family N-acetyltransferase [Candidatus Gottesmanbacteria bacterium]
MISIQEINQTTKEIEEFQKKEWALADLEEFGTKIDWTKQRKILKATENGTMVGFLELSLMAGVVRIESLIVKHEKHRQGIGTELVKEAIKIAQSLKAHKIFLNTSKTKRTSKFYESLGFVKTGEHFNHHDHQDYIIYSKNIS